MLKGNPLVPLFVSPLRGSNQSDKQDASRVKVGGQSEQRYLRGGEVTLEQGRSLFSQFCLLLVARGLSPWGPSVPGPSSLLHSGLSDCPP